MVKPVVHAVQAVVHKVADVYHAAVRTVKTVYHAAVRVVKKVYHAAVHVVKTAYHAVAKVVKSAAHAVVHAAAAVNHAVVSAAKSVAHTVAKAAVSTVHALASAVSHVGSFVKDHASTIAGVVAGVVVGAACTAATLGIGAVGCAALGGAVGGAVSYGLDCHSQGNCSVLGAVEAVGLGAIGGALGAGIAGSLGGRLIADALDGVLPEAATQGLVGGLSGAGSGGVTGGLDYALHCSGSCSVGGGLRAAGAGALAGGAGGAAFGALGGLRSARGRAPAGDCTHSFVGDTKVLMADGSRKPIASVKVGERVENSQPGKPGLETYQVDRVIVTQTDHDFVNLKVKPGRVRAVVGRAATAVAVAVGVAAGGSVPAVAAPVAGTPATVTTTYHHPFYNVTRAAFVEAVDLHVGDELQTADGSSAVVTEVTLYHTTEVTYDLTINNLHTYYILAGQVSVLVHNCGGSEPGTPDNYTAGGHAVRYSLTATVVGSDAKTIRNFNNVLNDGMHDVIAHGKRNGLIEIDGEEVNGGQLVDAIRANPGYVEGQPCRLIVCHSGVSGVGQQLSDELGVPVLGPNARVGTDRDLGPGQVPTVYGDAGWTQFYSRG
ncbi:polymorphic toxin-type HINT domain-containing protein [Amycolatopsis sp. NPDC047767]|uniref:polymorphic toxin-type HINT domain-containing protein n=1 Tax=Amycolatopsis sp. NPDC047767 TaxID=3156765 RepID=UPI0034538AA0